MTSIPADLRYINTDQWLRLEGAEGVIGITDYAQDQLNDVVYVDLPPVGKVFSKGERFGVVESVKSTNDLYMPASGEVIALNPVLQDTPEIVNADPYGQGWLIRIRLSDPTEWDSLLDASAYQADIAAR